MEEDEFFRDRKALPLMPRKIKAKPAEKAVRMPEGSKLTRQSKSERFFIEPAVLTVEEAAEYLRVSRQTAYNMANEGRLPVIRPVPGTIRVVKAKLDELLLNGTLGEVSANHWSRPAKENKTRDGDG